MINEKPLQMLMKVLPTVQRSGFTGLKMDDIARLMDVSKATLYKYFPSKDALVEAVVQQYTKYLAKASEEIADLHGDSRTRVLGAIFEKSLIVATYVSDVFVADVKSAYPDMYDALSASLDAWYDQLAACLREKMRQGVMRETNPVMVVLQLDTMLRRLLDVSLLMRHQLTLQTALTDFYLAMKQQMVRPEWQSDEEDAQVAAFVEYLAKKLTR